MPNSEHESTKLLRTTAADVVTFLGDGWSVDPSNPDYPTVNIDGPDGASLNLRGDSFLSIKKLEISGSYPKLLDGSWDHHSKAVGINVSISRGGKAIAGEIQRRLLPEYTKQLAEAIDRKAKAQANQDARAAIAQRIIDVLPRAAVATDRNGGPTDYRKVAVRSNSGDVWGSFSINGGVGIDLHGLTVDQAVRIAAIVAEPQPTDNDRTIAGLDDPAEREWLTNVKPEDVRDNAHRIYDFMTEQGIPEDSWTRELAFTKASERLGLDYNAIYDAWMHQRPLTAATNPIP